MFSQYLSLLNMIIDAKQFFQSITLGPDDKVGI